jgi:fibronectin type 3 domain-containing protein
MNMQRCCKRLMAVIGIALLMGLLAGCGGTSDSATPVQQLQPPAKPTTVTAAAGDTQIVVSWTPVTGATSYNIYYGTTTGVTTAGTKVVNATTPYTITGLTNSSAYYAVVTARNADGESAVSSEVSATPVPPIPAKPSGIVVSGGDTVATVSWAAVTGATSYNIYYGTIAGVTTATGTRITGATNPKAVSGLTNNTPYYFVVTAVNAGGESGISSEKPVTPAAAPQAPGNPTGVAVSGGVGQATVSWAAVTVATSYNVYYLLASTAPTTATVLSAGTKISSSSSPLVISGLASGTYYFSVTAANSGLESGGQTNPKNAVVQ